MKSHNKYTNYSIVKKFRKWKIRKQPSRLNGLTALFNSSLTIFLDRSVVKHCLNPFCFHNKPITILASNIQLSFNFPKWTSFTFHRKSETFQNLISICIFRIILFKSKIVPGTVVLFFLSFSFDFNILTIDANIQ